MLEASFEGHNDWVNDIIVLEDVLVSCSSDTIIKLWKADQSGRCPKACTACDKSTHLFCILPLYSARQVAVLLTQLGNLPSSLFSYASCPPTTQVGKGPANAI